ncbi:S41 family peptidase [Robiginitalea sediminis]|uniref:S41 family peptidase n=1 Tax=Robiginitalea sediminis TaxID=1982593 RepID=UPI000B4BCDD1|nr:S41 family peptidase [Robiginitalea sediminis]
MIEHTRLPKPLTTVAALLLFFLSLSGALAQGFEGYYRYPDIHGNQIVFTAEGDLWLVPVSGGLARRLTSHAEEETHAAFSPDGKTLAFSASYEGPTEVYTMPVSGGLPVRWTFESDPSLVSAWDPSGHLVYQTRAYSGVPDLQLVSLNPSDKTKTRIPLSQASEASFDDSGETVYFVRPAYHRNVTKRYKGGTARQIWKYTRGEAEAIRVTSGYTGESHHPMWYQGRVYFITDRDGTMNLWSSDPDGNDLQQHTRHRYFDIRYARQQGGRIVYQRGADIMLYDIGAGSDRKVEIRLSSDLDQLREKWEENPARYITHASPGPEGKNMVVTARGRVFVVPAEKGRQVAFTGKSGVRYRDAVLSHDGKSVYALSDESGEFEFVALPATGIGPEKSLTSDGEILRFGGVPSPDGKKLAYTDLRQHLYILDLATGNSTRVSQIDEYVGGMAWSPDSQWLAFHEAARNQMVRIAICRANGSDLTYLTTDRANSMSPQWSRDGAFLYFLSDRSFTSLVRSPWGSRQPEPYFDRKFKIYHIGLKKGARSPFRPADELAAETAGKKGDAKAAVSVVVERDGIARRLEEVPVPAGNYSNLALNEDYLYVEREDTGLDSKTELVALKLDGKDPEFKTVAKDIRSFELTANGKKILLRKGNSFYMVEAGGSEVKDLSDSQISLKDWKFPIDPAAEWKQMFTDAWRMERDYFYDPGMHGVDWDAMHDKYLPLVSRVTTRQELSDLIGRFVGELSALHTSVRGGDMREDDADIDVACLGGVFERDASAGGYRISKIYRADPDYPHERSPLDDPYLEVREGDVITHVNGIAALSATDLGALIRNQEGRQVRLGLAGSTGSRDIIVTPIGSDYNLRYRDWEYGNRMKVENASGGDIGYLHLRAMGGNDLSDFYREFYPVFDRKGLIVDVRYNFGGNIDSFILEKLMRKTWMYWATRNGQPSWNMQYAFRGHMVVLVNENTYSDGEAFADGFRKLGLGVTIGMRTWGGEIWLSSVNRLSDNGLARAPMMGVYGDNGEWLIEGHGFEPDIEVDNLPHATFNGADAQLDRALEVLKEEIRKDPREVPPPPPFPDKSFGGNARDTTQD